jgi:hypothetical protein
MKKRRSSWIRPAVSLVAILYGAIGCVDATPIVAPVSMPPHPVVVTTCSAATGQQLLDAAQYKQAIKEFTCVIDLDPTGVDGYRGRIEAQLMLGRFSDAYRDYSLVTAFVVPLHPDAAQVIAAGYQARLANAPGSRPALTGLSFLYWWDFNYPAAMHALDELLALYPDDVYGTLFRGSSRVLQGTKRAEGAADLDRAIALDPVSPDVRFIVADAYTYGSLPNPQRAFDEATFALNGGLDTPRIHAILGASYTAFGNVPAAALEMDLHIDQVTTELVPTSALAPASSKNLPLVPGRTFEIPIVVAAGELVSVLTSSKDFWDTILVLLAPDGTPVLGSDDFKGYFAGIEWVPPAAGTYRMRVTSFEGVNTGNVLVARK